MFLKVSFCWALPVVITPVGCSLWISILTSLNNVKRITSSKHHMPGMKTDESVALKFSVSFYAISDCTAFRDIFRNRPYFVYFVLHRLYVFRWDGDEPRVDIAFASLSFLNNMSKRKENNLTLVLRLASISSFSSEVFEKVKWTSLVGIC